MRVVVVDDEPISRLGVTARLKSQRDIEILAECGNGPEALRAIPALSPDLVFLDIQMPGLSGIDLLRQLHPIHRPSVVFLTAHEEYAVTAFAVEALDYLLKPIDDARFADCLSRARRLLALKQHEGLYESLQGLVSTISSGSARQYIQQFAVRQGGAVTFVKAPHVDWIEGLGDYAGLHVTDKTHLVREPLSGLAENLDPNRFLRIHRSSIVQLDRIVRTKSLPNRDLIVTLRDGTILRASRTYSASLFEALRTTTA